MATAVAETDSARSGRRPADESPQEIIARARTVVQQKQAAGASMRAALGMSCLTALLLWASFPPLNWSPLAWIAPVPLLSLVRLTVPTRRMMLAAYLGGCAFFIPALQWMRLGDPTMYIAWLALACYVAVSFPILVGVCRIALYRWSIPLGISAPVVWVGLEYARAHLLTGFAWYFLGHTQYRWLELIQISDLVGAYGVSLVMMMTAAALTSLLPNAWFRRLRLLPPSVALAQPAEQNFAEPLNSAVIPFRVWPAYLAVTVFALTLTYGYVRRGQADFQPGPRVALIQGNFLASLRIPPEDYGQQFLTHLRLTAHAVREQPDLIVWPESMFRWPLTSAPAGMSDEELQKLAPKAPPQFWRDTAVQDTLAGEARKAGAAILFGIDCVDLQKDGRIQRTNSAVLSRPDVGLAGRYDKIHLVPFGEYLPFQKSMPWLQKLTPYPSDFGLHAGQSGAVFDYGPWRMTPVICFEDTVPHLVRQLVQSGEKQGDGKPVDLLVNLSNDGWFHGSSGLDQHLITAAFRAVECRTPLVRAVNTGVSAFIDGDGGIMTPETFIDGDRQGRTSPRDPKTGAWYKQLNAAQVTTVPLDHRRSFYVQSGDWFAMLCLGSTLFLLMTACVPRQMFTKR